MLCSRRTPAAMAARAEKYAHDFVIVEIGKGKGVEGALMAALLAQHPLKTPVSDGKIIYHWPDFCACSWSALTDGGARKPADAVAALLAHKKVCKAKPAAAADIAAKRDSRGEVVAAP